MTKPTQIRWEFARLRRFCSFQQQHIIAPTPLYRGGGVIRSTEFLKSLKLKIYS